MHESSSSLPKSPQELNLELQRIHQLLEKNRDWKDQLDFNIQRKSGSSQSTRRQTGAAWEKVYDLTSLDLETICLLASSDRALWVKQPEHFVSFHHSPALMFPHPTVQMSWQCLMVKKVDARTTILRRCSYVALWDVKRKFDLPTEFIAQQLAPYLLFALEQYQNQTAWAQYQNKTAEELQMTLVHELNNIIDAGSRYSLIDKEVGTGTMVVLGTTLSHNL